MNLPESWQFLGSWWWALHLVSITAVFYLGYVVGYSRGAESHPGKPDSDPSDSTA